MTTWALLWILLLHSCTNVSSILDMKQGNKRAVPSVNAGDIEMTVVGVEDNTSMDDVGPTTGGRKLSSSPNGKGSGFWKVGLGCGLVGLLAGFGIGFGTGYGPLKNTLNECNSQVNTLNVELYGSIKTGNISSSRLLQSSSNGTYYEPGCLAKVFGYVDPLTKNNIFGYESMVNGNDTNCGGITITGHDSSIISAFGLLEDLYGGLNSTGCMGNLWGVNDSNVGCMNTLHGNTSLPWNDSSIVGYIDRHIICNTNLNSLTVSNGAYAQNLSSATIASNMCSSNVGSLASSLSACTNAVTNNNTAVVISCTTYDPNCYTCNSTVCTSCNSPYFLVNNGMACAKCNNIVPQCASCATTSSGVSCSNCITGYNLIGNTCITASTTPALTGSSNKNLLVGYFMNSYGGGGNNYPLLSEIAQIGYNVVPIAFASISGTNIDWIGNQFLPYTSWQTFSGCQQALTVMTNDMALARTRGMKYILASIGGETSPVTLPANGTTALSTLANNMIAFQNLYTLDGFDWDIENAIGAAGAQSLAALNAMLRQQNSTIIISGTPQMNVLSNGTISLVTTGVDTGYNLAVSQGTFTHLWPQLYNTGGWSIATSSYPNGCGEYDACVVPAVVKYLRGQLSNNLPPVIVPNNTSIIIGIPASKSAAGIVSVWNNPYGYSVSQQTGFLIGNYSSLFNMQNGAQNINGAMTWDINWDIADNCIFANKSLPVLGFSSTSVCPVSTAGSYHGGVNLNNCVAMGTPLPTSTPTCANITANCLTCNSAYNDCFSCSGGLYPSNTATGAPCASCSTIFPYCSACSTSGFGQTSCTACNTNYSLGTNGCQPTSNAPSNTGQCNPTITNCYTCNTLGTTCTACNSGYILANNNCNTRVGRVLAAYWCGFSGSFCGQSTDFSDINPAATHIIMAFANTNSIGGIVVDGNNWPYSLITTAQGRGQKVLISVGGQNADWTSVFANSANFVQSVKSVINTYGIDGVDLDIENGNATPQSVASTINSLRTALGSGKIITIAPQSVGVYQGTSIPSATTNTTVGAWNFFVPVINSAIGSINYVFLQCYNNPYDGNTATSTFLENQMLQWMNQPGLGPWEGSFASSIYIGVPANKMVMGVPGSPTAANSGYYATPAVISQSVSYLVAQGYPPVGGMYWDSHWDALNTYLVSNAFVTSLGL